jgi:hypothetical protein
VGSILLAASASCVQINPERMVHLGDFTINGRLAVMSVLLFGMAVFKFLLSTSSEQRVPAYGCAAVAVLTGIFALQPANLLATYLVTTAAALFAYCITASAVAQAAADLLLGSSARSKPASSAKVRSNA